MQVVVAASGVCCGLPSLTLKLTWLMYHHPRLTLTRPTLALAMTLCCPYSHLNLYSALKEGSNISGFAKGMHITCNSMTQKVEDIQKDNNLANITLYISLQMVQM